MSLFDKLTESAKKARDALEESGVLDDLGDLANEAGEKIRAAASSAEGESPDSGQAPLAGVPSALTVGEVAEITGMPFDTSHPHNDEEWAGTIFQCSDRNHHQYFELRYGKAPAGELYDPDDRWSFLVTEVDPQIPVSGLTEGAFRSSDEVVFFRAANNVYHTAGNLGADMGRLMVALAKRAVENLEA